MNPSKLALDPEEMRRLGYLVVDTIVGHFSALAEKPVTERASRAELEAQFREPPPECGGDPEAFVKHLSATVFRSHMHVDHPRFFAFIPSTFATCTATGRK